MDSTTITKIDALVAVNAQDEKNDAQIRAKTTVIEKLIDDILVADGVDNLNRKFAQRLCHFMADSHSSVDYLDFVEGYSVNDLSEKIGSPFTSTFGGHLETPGKVVLNTYYLKFLKQFLVFSKNYRFLSHWESSNEYVTEHIVVCVNRSFKVDPPVPEDKTHKFYWSYSDYDRERDLDALYAQDHENVGHQ